MFYLLIISCLPAPKPRGIPLEACLEDEFDDIRYQALDSIKIRARINITYTNKTTNEQYIKTFCARWNPRVDKVSVLEIPDSDCRIVNANHSTIEIGTATCLSDPLFYRLAGDYENYTVDFYNVVLNFNEGINTEINLSTETKCKISCPDYPHICITENRRTRNFDTCERRKISVFVGYKGTDSKGKLMTSAAGMPSSVTKHNFNDLVDWAKARFSFVFKFIDKIYKLYETGGKDEL